MTACTTASADLQVVPPCTCFRLRRAARAITRLYDQHLATVGLKTTQYSLLMTAALGPQPVARLAEQLGLERTTLTRNLQPLVAAGWIAVTAGADARQRIVTLTAAGRERARLGKAAWKQAQRQVETTFGGPFVAQLHQQIDHVFDTLDGAAPVIR
jgi:DNA-binding MarR family transcriptional regulator